MLYTGARPREILGVMAFGKMFTVHRTGELFLGRTLAFVIADGANTSKAMFDKEMFELGLVWRYLKYNPSDALAALAADA